jgi:hypothetical protein
MLGELRQDKIGMWQGKTSTATLLLFCPTLDDWIGTWGVFANWIPLALPYSTA